MIELAPSIFSADFARLGEDAQAAVEGGATVLHVDIMDRNFVPNLTIGPPRGRLSTQGPHRPFFLQHSSFVFNNLRAIFPKTPGGGMSRWVTTSDLPAFRTCNRFITPFLPNIRPKRS